MRSSVQAIYMCSGKHVIVVMGDRGFMMQSRLQMVSHGLCVERYVESEGIELRAGAVRECVG